MSMNTGSMIFTKVATASFAASLPVTSLVAISSDNVSVDSKYIEHAQPQIETFSSDLLVIKNTDDAQSLFQKLRTICQNAMIEDQKLFYELFQEWHAETVFNSDSMQSVMSKSYQRIIGMGKRALPFIFKELPKCLDDWFWALEAITGENPVKPEHYSSFKSSIQDWVLWGREHGYQC